MTQSVLSPSVQKVLLVGHITGMVGAIGAALFAISHKATYGSPTSAAIVALIIYGFSLSLSHTDYPGPILAAACVATFPTIVIPLMMLITGPGALFSYREMTPDLCILPSSALLTSATVMELMLRGEVGKGLLILSGGFVVSAIIWIGLFNIFFYQ